MQENLYKDYNSEDEFHDTYDPFLEEYDSDEGFLDAFEPAEMENDEPTYCDLSRRITSPVINQALEIENKVRFYIPSAVNQLFDLLRDEKNYAIELLVKTRIWKELFLKENPVYLSSKMHNPQNYENIFLEAFFAICFGGGLCTEMNSLAFMLAVEEGIPVMLIMHSKMNHLFCLLPQDNKDPIILDSWTNKRDPVEAGKTKILLEDCIIVKEYPGDQTKGEGARIVQEVWKCLTEKYRNLVEKYSSSLPNDFELEASLLVEELLTIKEKVLNENVDISDDNDELYNLTTHRYID